MKNLLKYFLFSAGLLFIIIVLFIYLYRNFVIDNLRNKELDVDSKWSELFQNSSNRIVFFNELAFNIQNNNIFYDSLKISLRNNFKRRTDFEDECSLDFLTQEYVLNKQYFKLLMAYQKDSILRTNAIDTLVRKLKRNDENLNKIVDEYNNKAQSFNTDISVFPNFFFAKRNGFHRKKYFTIKYGVENEDPVAKNQELPEWAKGKDTL